MRKQVLFAMVSALFVSQTADASGYHRLNGATHCVFVPGANPSSVNIDASSGTLYNSGLNAAEVVCAVPDTDVQQSTPYYDTTVYVDSPRGYGVSVRTCVKFASADGYYCGPWSNSWAAGKFALAADVSAWTSYPWDFKYIEVSLPSGSTNPAQYTAAGKLFGYTLHY